MVAEAERLPIPWETLESVFRPVDEWLLDPHRDIVVPDVDLDDWQRIVDFLHAPPISGGIQTATTVDGTPAPLPRSAAEVFEVRRVATLITWIDFRGIEVVRRG